MDSILVFLQASLIIRTQMCPDILVVNFFLMTSLICKSCVDISTHRQQRVKTLCNMPRSLNVKLGPRRNYHKGRAVWLAQCLIRTFGWSFLKHYSAPQALKCSTGRGIHLHYVQKVYVLYMESQSGSPYRQQMSSRCRYRPLVSRACAVTALLRGPAAGINLVTSPHIPAFKVGS